ncbi:MAG: isoprenylcysteine carboxylmethyltransferase family protein [Proteobacteria bacterium]|nr:isoprenylcysteine carboxylmethyltransferase family protein [Pseudomonadota bacterium]
MTYLAMAGLFFSGLAVRMVYERGKKNGWIDPSSRTVFAVVFLGMSAMWAGWFEMCPADPLKMSLPALLHWAGLALFLAGLGLALVAVIQLRGLEDIRNLVTTGLFARIRHPMYLGFILWFVGWPVYHGAGASLLIGLVGIAAVLHWRRAEERALAVRFGDAYPDYRRRTWW